LNVMPEPGSPGPSTAAAGRPDRSTPLTAVDRRIVALVNALS
jgi:hypothetical protein